MTEIKKTTVKKKTVVKRARTVNIKVQLDNDECMPFKKHKEDAGYDLKAKARITITKLQTREIHTGVKMEIPDGHVGLLCMRSSFGKKGLRLMNSIGIIDSNYRGEIKMLVRNEGKLTINIKEFERVGQLVIVPIPHFDIVVSDLSDTERGTGGFGSTGTHD